MKRALAAFSALIAFGACAAGAAAASDDGLSWIYSADQSRLYYAVADSDDIAASLECDAGQVRVAEYGAAPTGRREAELTLASGDRTAVLKVQRSSDPMFDEVVETTAPLSSPVIERFARTGDVTVARDGMRHRFAAATPTEMAEVRRFFAGCGSA